MTKYFVFGFLSILIFLSSCQDESISADNTLVGGEYFPLEIGKYITYQSDSITYAIQGSRIDTSSSIIKEELTDILVSDNGDTSYIITRYIKDTPDGAFKITDKWTTAFKDGQFTKTEENIKLVKLSLPTNLNATWNPTAFIDENIRVEIAGETLQPYRFWGAEITAEHADYMVDGDIYTDVIEVNYVDNSDIIEKRYVTEWYAAGIGLIKQEMQILDTQCTNCDNLSWEQKAEKGFISSLELIDHN